jgi:hypothetical protein
MSLDPITGFSQTRGVYWKRIKSEFDERKLTNKGYTKNVPKQNATSHRWSIIQLVVNKFHGFIGNIGAQKESGNPMEDKV